MCTTTIQLSVSAVALYFKVECSPKIVYLPWLLHNYSLASPCQPAAAATAAASPWGGNKGSSRMSNAVGQDRTGQCCTVQLATWWSLATELFDC